MLQPGQDFHQQTKDEQLVDDLEQLVRLAVREDLSRGFDLTTVAVVPEGLAAKAHIVPRQEGVAAGIDLVDVIIEALDADLSVQC